jgi:hypothetical protein
MVQRLHYGRLWTVKATSSRFSSQYAGKDKFDASAEESETKKYQKLSLPICSGYFLGSHSSV